MKTTATTPDALVDRIAALQSTGADGVAGGLFPARRTHRYLPYAVTDDSVFPTAVTVYLLQQVRDALPEESRQTIDAVIRRAVAVYPRYRNNRGRPMYNFWQTLPEDRFFPNGRFLSRFRHFRLPEDIDTTAYVYLTQPHATADAEWFKERLLLDTNGRRRRIRSTLPAYGDLPAYSTWLGEANMPLDFDVCALANLLLFVHAYDLPWNAHDDASLRFITEVVRSGDHLRHPFRVAPWYADPAVICYHVARLAAVLDAPALTACRDGLRHDVDARLERESPFMTRLLLSTARMRLGGPPAVRTLPGDLDAAAARFPFFVGSLLTAVDHPFARALAPWDLFHVRYYCPALALALVLEHEVMVRERHWGMATGQ